MNKKFLIAGITGIALASAIAAPASAVDACTVKLPSLRPPNIGTYFKCK